ncbi:MAG: HEAT repeat domain-containing protein [Acidobacteriota bacterium]
MMTATPDMAPPAAYTVARALTIGLRAWSFYPPEHPAVSLAVDRLVTAVHDATRRGVLQLAVTPHTLLIAGRPVESPDMVVAECARQLYERDILQLTFASTPPADALTRLLEVLTLERGERRARGGPQALWSAEGHPSIIVEQIDYQELLEREDVDAGPARRDVHWKSIVRSILAGRRTFSEAEQARLLEIAGDVGAIGELTGDCVASFHTPEGVPLVTTQAATVLAVYRHLSNTVGTLEPDKAGELMQSLAVATCALDPSLGLEVLCHPGSGSGEEGLIESLRQAFDDHQVAMLLARAMARQGGATGRLAQIVETLAPDDERRRRVLRMADKLLGERDFGATRPLADIRASLEELLLKYDETPFVSAQYRQSMDAAVSRAGDIAARDLPPELAEWLDTLGHENVRQLSVTLIVDLMRLETGARRAEEIAQDMAAFAQDLVLAGAFGDAARLAEALSASAAAKDGPAPQASIEALRAIGESAALGDAVGAIAELSPPDVAALGSLCHALGGASVRALLRGLPRDGAGAGRDRVMRILTDLGPPALSALAHAADDNRWWVQIAVAEALGRIGGPAAVPPLQGLLRRSDRRVLAAAVGALAQIDDPSAARALHTVLRAAAGEARGTVIGALVGLRDARTVPMLVRILGESDALGKDHAVAIDALKAMAELADDRAVTPIVGVARQRRWLAWGRTRRLRTAAVAALGRIGSEAARRALDDLAATGDWHLRRLARSAPRGRA